MDMKFMKFLSEKHAESVAGTEDDCIDDYSPDRFDSWYEYLDLEQMALYAEMFANREYLRGYNDCKNDIDAMIGRITAK